MIHPKKPFVQRMGNGIIAMVWATGVTALFGVSPNLLPVLPVVFVASWTGLYIFLDWLFIRRPEQVKKNVPTTSKEWQRKQKEFYDNLPR